MRPVPTDGSLWAVPESSTGRLDWPESPPPPWRATVRATLWWHRATDDGVRLGPAGRTIPLTVAMVVDYLDSPVGRYREVMASPVVRAPGRAGALPAIAVPFIAVDSAMSVHGGRTHWRLPKVLATFSGDADRDMTALGDGWSVRATARPRGPRLPIVGVLPFAQPTPDGGTSRAHARLRGRAHWARVDVSAQGPSLSRWLVSGTHHGVVITDGTLTVAPARVKPA